MHHAKDIDWREQYRQVLFEADREKLLVGIEATHQTVQQRILALWDVEPVDVRELTQLAYASYFLGLLTRITEQHQEAEGPTRWAFKPEERRP
jgi:hypothetical protein